MRGIWGILGKMTSTNSLKRQCHIAYGSHLAQNDQIHIENQKNPGPRATQGLGWGGLGCRAGGHWGIGGYWGIGGGGVVG